MRTKLATQVVSLEIRNILSYRVDFWTQFLVSLFSHVAIAYFLWSSIYEANQTDLIGGLSFHEMMLYYLLVPLSRNIVTGQERGFMADDIYQGTLNRYLVYPLSFYFMQYLNHFARGCVGLMQLVIFCGGFLFFFGRPENSALSLLSVTAGILVFFIAAFLFYAIETIVEMTAFWADNVWSLSVMNKFVVSFLGGGMIPLTLFPDWAQFYLKFLPFAHLIYFPIQIFLGNATSQEIFFSISMIALWSIVFVVLGHLIWRRGLLRYSGVGI